MRIIEKTRTPKGMLKWVVEYKRKKIEGGYTTQTQTLYGCTQAEVKEQYKLFKVNNSFYDRLVGCKKERRSAKLL